MRRSCRHILETVHPKPGSTGLILGVLAGAALSLLKRLLLSVGFARLFVGRC